MERELDSLWFQAEVRAVRNPPLASRPSLLEGKEALQKGMRPPSYVYDLWFADIENLEKSVPEEEIRLKVTGLADVTAASADDTDMKWAANSVPVGIVLGDNEDRIDLPDAKSPISNKGGEGKFASHHDGEEEDPFSLPSSNNGSFNTNGLVTMHNVDDNDRFQSTGTAYLTHGEVTGAKAAGGGGLRAIRLLRK